MLTPCKVFSILTAGEKSKGVKYILLFSRTIKFCAYRYPYSSTQLHSPNKKANKSNKWEQCSSLPIFHFA